jgi:CubicO group peptidase (beta-lactamase class C family)
MATRGREARNVGSVRDLGLDPDRLRKLKQTIEQDTAHGTYDGAVFIVARGGRIGMFEAVGHADLAKQRRAKKNDVFFIMSLTKQMTAVRVLMAVEEGKFTLTTPLREVLPEFGIKGKQNITVFHILTHTSGLNTELPITLPLDKVGDIEEVVRAYSQERLLYLPGRIVTYNPIASLALLAAMVQRLDEKRRPFRTIMREDVFAPLRMTDTFLGLPDGMRGRVAPVVVRDPTPGIFDAFMIESMNTMVAADTELPSGGAVSTAHDVFRFTEMLRQGGELDGTRLLAPETVELAVANHTGEMPNHLLDYMREMYGWPEFPANLGLTFFLRGEGVFPTPLGLTTSPWTYAGLGAGSTMFWVDPEKDLTFVFLSTGLLEEGRSFMRHQRLSDMVVAALVD